MSNLCVVKCGRVVRQNSEVLQQRGYPFGSKERCNVCLMLKVSGAGWNEFQADYNAVKMGYADDLISALKKISLENKQNLNPDWLYAWYHFSHPTLVERIDYIEKSNVELDERKERKKLLKTRSDSEGTSFKYIFHFLACVLRLLLATV